MEGCFGRAWHSPFPEARTIWGEKAQGTPLRCYRGLEAVEGTGMHHPLQRCWFPPPCKGAQAPSRTGEYMHITAVVRLCHSFGSFCKRISRRKPFAEPSLPLPASTPIRHHVPHKSSLFLTSGFSSLLCSLGREQALKHPTDAKAGLCLPAVLRKSWPRALSAVQMSTVHTLWQKIGSTLGISSVPSSRCGDGVGSQELVGW